MRVGDWNRHRIRCARHVAPVQRGQRGRRLQGEAREASWPGQNHLPAVPVDRQLRQQCRRITRLAVNGKSSVSRSASITAGEERRNLREDFSGCQIELVERRWVVVSRNSE